MTGGRGPLPRKTKLGPCNGLLHPLPAFGTDLAVNRRFFKDVAEADRAAGFLAAGTSNPQLSDP